MVTPATVLALADRAALRGVGAGGVILDTVSGDIYSCNETAQDFLSRLDGRRSVADIAREMTADYEVTETELCEDMVALMDGLVADGLVQTA